MSHLFVTADMHLGHANICRYCGRPWIKDGDLNSLGEWITGERKDACAYRMNRGLVTRWNSRVSDDDTVIHIGDFCCRGNEKGVSGVRVKADEWEGKLNGKIIHIRGNHDKNNGVRFALENATIYFGNLTMFMIHIPPQHQDEIPRCDLVLCGHIHDKWKMRLLDGGIPMFNVGVDTRKFMPVRADEIVSEYWRWRNECKDNGRCLADGQVQREQASNPPGSG